MQNLLMQLTRHPHLSRWLLMLPLLWGSVLADSYTSTRIGNYDWACADAQGTRLSSHVRLDKAIEACVNRAYADGNVYIVLSGEGYRIVPTIDEVETVTVSWVAPTHNVDGTQLTDLAGYKLYYGPTCGNYTNVITIDNKDLTSYVLDLPTGGYCAVITAYDVDGDESDPSGERSFTL